MQELWIGFDLDDVIVRGPFTDWIEPHLRRTIAEGSHRVSSDGWHRDGPLDQRIAADVRRAFTRLASEDPVRAFDWDELYGTVANDWGVASLPDVAELVNAYLDRPGTSTALPGAVEALEAAANAGFRVAATTNGFARFQLPILDALGLRSRFDAVVTPDRAGACKPSPRYFGARPGLVAHVGDSLWQDVRGARRAGVDALWVHPEAPHPASDDGAPIAAIVARVAPQQRRLPTPGRSDEPEDLLPHVAGRTAVDVIEAWLARRG